MPLTSHNLLGRVHLVHESAMDPIRHGASGVIHSSVEPSPWKPTAATAASRSTFVPSTLLIGFLMERGTRLLIQRFTFLQHLHSLQHILFYL